MSNKVISILINRWNIINKNSYLAFLTVTLTANFIVMGLTIITGALGARMLGVQGKGELTAIQLWPMMIAILGSLGLTQSLTYFTSRKPQQGLTYVTTSWLILIPLAIFWMIVGYIFIPYLLQAQSYRIIQASRVFLLIVPLEFMAVSFGALRGWKDFNEWNIVRVQRPVIYLLLLCAAWLIGLNDPVQVSRLILLASFAIIPSLLFVLSRHGKFNKAIPEVILLKPLLGYGYKAALGGIPFSLNARLDQLIIAAFLSPSLLGIYVVAVTWSKVPIPIIRAIGSVSFPDIASRINTIDSNMQFARILRLSLLMCIAITIAIFLLTPVAIPLLFGQDFLPSIIPAMVLVIAGFFLFMNIILKEGLRGLGFPGATAWAEGTGLVFTILFLLLLLPKYKILGAAIASLAAYSITFIVLVAYTVLNTKLRIREIMIPKKEDLRTLFRKFSVPTN